MTWGVGRHGSAEEVLNLQSPRGVTVHAEILGPTRGDGDVSPFLNRIPAPTLITREERNAFWVYEISQVLMKSLIPWWLGPSGVRLVRLLGDGATNSACPEMDSRSAQARPSVTLSARGHVSAPSDKNMPCALLTWLGGVGGPQSVFVSDNHELESRPYATVQDICMGQVNVTQVDEERWNNALGPQQA